MRNNFPLRFFGVDPSPADNLFNLSLSPAADVVGLFVGTEEGDGLEEAVAWPSMPTSASIPHVLTTPSTAEYVESAFDRVAFLLFGQKR